ncbi:MAG: helix-turn-helix domain-containing protein, partial [Anaerolinea sp.]|nr:helix-turn-helix domain-containing protein [Anaerolinea sp.]
LKIYFDPLRQRILHQIADQARSIQEIATALEIPFTRLYYHINLLEKHGLIRLVDVRPGPGAIEEKFYRVAARFFVVDQALMTPGTPKGEAGLATVISTVLDETRASIYTALRSGLIDPAQRAPHPDALMIVRGVFPLTPELVEEFQTRLKALLAEFTARKLASMKGTRPYNFALVLHPTVLEGEAADDPAGRPDAG